MKENLKIKIEFHALIYTLSSRKLKIKFYAFKHVVLFKIIKNKKS